MKNINSKSKSVAQDVARLIRDVGKTAGKSANKGLKQGKKKVQQLARRGRNQAMQAGAAVAKTASGIHHASHAYLGAMLNPCDRARVTAGLPKEPHDDSLVSRGFVDFVMSTGTMGYGFIALNPTIVNDNVAFSYSSSAYTGTTIPAMNAAATGQVTGAVANLPYNTAALSFTSANSLYGRIVSCGVEILSTTAPLYVQGQIQGYTEPSHSTIGGYTSAAISGRKGAWLHPLENGQEYSVFTTPVVIADSAYSVTSNPYNANANAVIAGILVSGASLTNVASFMCRLTIDVEYAGVDVEALAKPKPIPEPDAFHTCVQVANKIITAHAQSSLHGKKNGKQLWDLAAKAYSYSRSPAAKSGIGFVKGIAGLFI